MTSSLARFCQFFYVAAGVLGAPGTWQVADGTRHTVDARQDNGFAVQYWANGNANLNWTNGQGGHFMVGWDQQSGGNFVVGKGYSSGDMLVNYTGHFEVWGNAYLTLYGWTTEPLIEWYVIESFGHHNPSDNRNSTCYGTFESDGGTYEVWMKWRVNAPSIIGDATFMQFWSVRTTRRVGGTINTTRHFEAYERAGLRLGTHQPHNMVVGIEGQQGIGSADITVGDLPSGTVPEDPTPTTRTERPSETSTCTGSL
ncbi:concanavalin A-like lectin/glucanase domain-containing protein [Stachybotrys elegans]|uniref:Endo-1,4-beta-xylanase n=1 Tax=Stachybotrys elegans TaxID=80388 RepID=A0A8K0SJ56_9HYPO|nr:concanavalin A-like lectin/glucanase domain-containing protein [Stachybotrys elegans]